MSSATASMTSKTTCNVILSDLHWHLFCCILISGFTNVEELKICWYHLEKMHISGGQTKMSPSLSTCVNWFGDPTKSLDCTSTSVMDEGSKQKQIGHLFGRMSLISFVRYLLVTLYLESSLMFTKNGLHRYQLILWQSLDFSSLH